MKARHSLLILPIATSLLFSSCSMNLFGAELIHPPKTTGSQAQIEQLIETAANGSYTLKYPKHGSFRSAIIMEDINNDQKQEAIAFYHINAETPKTHMLVMYDNGSEWIVSYNYETSYADVDCIEFTDYDFDGHKEIFTGFVTETPGINELTVFDFDNKTYETTHVDFTYPYSNFTTGDYDQDGANEAMLLTLKTSETEARATLVDYDNNELYALASCSIDSTVTKYEKVLTGIIEDNKKGVVIEGLLTNGYNSQVILYDVTSKSLINSLSSSSVSTERAQTLYSSDIDEDTFIEVPQLSVCNTPKNQKEGTPSPLITWYHFNTGNYEFELDQSCITNYEYKYGFYLPINFIGTTTTLVSEDKKTMSIYEFNKNKANTLLITFKVFDKNANTENYTILESNSNYSYGYKINEGELPLYIDDKTIQENFALYELSVQ